MPRFGSTFHAAPFSPTNISSRSKSCPKPCHTSHTCHSLSLFVLSSRLFFFPSISLSVSFPLPATTNQPQPPPIPPQKKITTTIAVAIGTASESLNEWADEEAGLEAIQKVLDSLDDIIALQDANCDPEVLASMLRDVKLHELLQVIFPPFFVYFAKKKNKKILQLPANP